MRNNEIKKLCKFKGKNGSLGYKTGSAYMLILSESRDRVDKLETTIHIKRTSDNLGRCIYSNWDKFLENWEVIG